jgi:hemerythrin-like metal-binding protein
LSDQAPARQPLLVWKDQFATGMPGVDHEHRQLIELINSLFERMGRNCSGELTREFLGELYARTSAHFALEEKIMREARYDQYDLLKSDHERLLDRLRDIMNRPSRTRGTAAAKISARISSSGFPCISVRTIRGCTSSLAITERDPHTPAGRSSGMTHAASPIAAGFLRRKMRFHR